MLRGPRLCPRVSTQGWREGDADLAKEEAVSVTA
jgi:hypothetical protein